MLRFGYGPNIDIFPRKLFVPLVLFALELIFNRLNGQQFKHYLRYMYRCQVFIFSFTDSAPLYRFVNRPRGGSTP